MASVELLFINKDGKEDNLPSNAEWTLNTLHGHKSSTSVGRAISREHSFNLAKEKPVCEGQCNSAPRTAPERAENMHSQQVRENEIQVCCDEELETCFTYVDENVNLQRGSPQLSRKRPHGAQSGGSFSDIRSEGFQELSLISDDELVSESSGKVDYGFISAVTFLVTGISLVVISYAVPREVTVNKDSVSAREMEQLENENAKIGVHLDRCVIAGLCLLTLGGAVLSTLLMISMWKGEVYGRKALAYSKQSAKLYGSVNLRIKPTPAQSSSLLSVDKSNPEFIN